MANEQTRRSISFNGAVHDLLREYCAKNDLSMSDVVQSALMEKIGTKAQLKKWNKYRDRMETKRKIKEQLQENLNAQKALELEL